MMELLKRIYATMIVEEVTKTDRHKRYAGVLEYVRFILNQMVESCSLTLLDSPRTEVQGR